MGTFLNPRHWEDAVHPLISPGPQEAGSHYIGLRGPEGSL